MKKHYIIFLLGSMGIIYPLTDADWRVIYSLKAGSIVTGTAAGGFLGYQAGTYLGGHVVPAAAATTGRYFGRRKYSAAPVPPAQRGVLESQYHAQVHRGFKREFERSRFNPLRLAPAAAITGGTLGSLAADRLAIAYIARKYGVDYETAWQAIKDNLDLSQRIKK